MPLCYPRITNSTEGFTETTTDEDNSDAHESETEAHQDSESKYHWTPDHVAPTGILNTIILQNIKEPTALVDWMNSTSFMHVQCQIANK